MDKKPISKTKANRLLKAGARIVKDPVEKQAEEETFSVAELREMVEAAKGGTEAAHKTIDAVHKSLQSQIDNLSRVVESIAADRPEPLAGFRMNRNADGQTETVTFIRSKPMVN